MADEPALLFLHTHSPPFPEDSPAALGWASASALPVSASLDVAFDWTPGVCGPPDALPSTRAFNKVVRTLSTLCSAATVFSAFCIDLPRIAILSAVAAMSTHCQSGGNEAETSVRNAARKALRPLFGPGVVCCCGGGGGGPAGGPGGPGAPGGGGPPGTTLNGGRGGAEPPGPGVGGGIAI